MSSDDIEQKIDILETLEKQVVFLENQELAQALMRFKSQNVQWVLNAIQEVLGEMQEAVDYEEFSQNWS